MQHTKARGNSKSRKFWTSLNHLKNVLSYVNVRYHFHFRLHTDTWKTISFMNCLVNIWKYTLRHNPPFRKMPSIFSYSSTFNAAAKSMSNIRYGKTQKAVFQHFTINCWLWSHSRNSTGLAVNSRMDTHSAWILHDAIWVQYVEEQEGHILLLSAAP